VNLLENVGFLANEPPKIIPLPDERPLPPFPLGALPSIPRAFAISISESVEVDFTIAALDILSALAGVFGGKYQVKPKQGHTEGLNMFTVNIDEPSGRKSPVKKIVFRAFEDIENKIRIEKSCEVSEAQARLTIAKRDYDKALKKSDDTDYIIAAKQHYDELERSAPKLPRLIVDSITVEKLCEVMAENSGRLIRTSGEAGVLADVKGGRYNQCSDIDNYLSAFSGERFSRDSKSGGTVIVDNPALTISIAAQVGRVKGFIADSECMERGLCGRFLYAFGISTAGKRSAYAPALQGEKEWAAVIEKCFDVTQFEGVRDLTISPEAFAIYANKYSEIHNDKLLNEWEYMSCWAGKSHLLRIVGNLHCVECVLKGVEPSSVTIAADTLQRGIDIFDCLSAHAEKAYLLNDKADNDMSNARHLLFKKLKDVTTISVRDLWQKCKGTKRFEEKEDLSEPLSVLEEHGYLTFETIQTGGRPSEVIRMTKM
jgi:hypothetical protein